MWVMLGKWLTVPHNSSQAARTRTGSLFTENADVEKKFILKFNGKEICCDADWDVIIKGSAERKVDKNAATRIRVFPVEV